MPQILESIVVSDKNVISKHKENAHYYNKELKNTNGVTLLENKKGHNSAYWIYTIKVERQDDFMDKMQEKIAEGYDVIFTKRHHKKYKGKLGNSFLYKYLGKLERFSNGDMKLFSDGY